MEHTVLLDSRRAAGIACWTVVSVRPGAGYVLSRAQEAVIREPSSPTKMFATAACHVGFALIGWHLCEPALVSELVAADWGKTGVRTCMFDNLFIDNMLCSNTCLSFTKTTRRLRYPSLDQLCCTLPRSALS